MKWLIALGSVLTLFAAATAEDITTANGLTLRDANFSDEDEDSVLVRHRGGGTRIHLFDLPADVQRRFHFDPIAALRRKTAEVERLKAELAAARGEVVAAKAVAQAAPRANDGADNSALWAGHAPTPTAAGLPPVGKNEAVDVFDLVNHHRADAATAIARYKGHDFRIEGVVERIEDQLVGRTVKILCESPDRGIRVVIAWRVPDDYPKFYTKAEGRRLFGVAGGAARIVLQAGDRATFAVRGGAYDDGAVFLNRGELLARVKASP